MPGDTDPSREGVSEGNGGAVADVVADGDGDSEICENEREDSPDDCFYGGKGAITLGRVSLRAASKSGGSGTEDDPADPVLNDQYRRPDYPRNGKHKPTAMDFSSRTISSHSTDLMMTSKSGWTQRPHPLCRSNPHPFVTCAKSRKCRDSRSAHVTALSRSAEGPHDLSAPATPRSVPQMSTARWQYGGWTQRGSRVSLLHQILGLLNPTTCGDNV